MTLPAPCGQPQNKLCSVPATFAERSTVIRQEARCFPREHGALWREHVHI